MTQLKSDSPIKKRQIVNLQIIDEDVKAAAGIVTTKLADGYLFIKKDGTVVWTADQSHGGYKITNLGAPTADNDAVRKIDLETAQAGQIPKEAARVATTSSDGNQTLTGLLTIDGVTVSAGNRVLIKNQTTASTNGIYVAAAGAWSRSTDADAGSEVVAGTSIFISEGTENAYTTWTQSTLGTLTIDVSDLIWVQASKAVQVLAGAGMTKSSNTLNVIGTTNRILVNADDIDISPNYVGQNTITTLGTITTGHWHGDAIENAYLANSTITFALGTTGTNATWSGSPTSLGGTITLNLPSSSASNRGLLTAADWTTFNGKQAALGYTPISNALTDGYIIIGNGSNIATGVALTGQIAITNLGVSTISNAAVIAKVLTGYTSGSGTISATDSILSAIQKLGHDKHVAVTLKTGSKAYIELSGQEINATAIDLSASYVTGTISSTILGNSSLYIGTTQIALNRASGAQTLTGITAIDGSAGKWTTARLLAGNSVDGSANVAFANKFIVQGTVDAGLSGAQFLGALGTGLLRNTTATGVLTVITDNSANWNTAYNDRVVSAAFDENNGILTLTQQDAGTVIVDLDGRYMLSSGRLLNNQWFEVYDYAGNVANLFKISKDNTFVLGVDLEVNTLYAPTDAGRVNFAKMPVGHTSTVGQELSLGIAIGTRNQFRVVGIANGTGGLSDDYVWITSRLQLDTIAHETTDVDKFLVSNTGAVKYRTGSEILSDIAAEPKLNGSGYVFSTGTVTSYVSNPLVLLNDQWFLSYTFNGNSANLLKLSKDNVVEFGYKVGISSLYHVADSTLGDIVDIPITPASASGTEHGVGISVGGIRLLKLSALSDGSGGIGTGTLAITGNITGTGNLSLTGNIISAAANTTGAYDLLVRKQSTGIYEKIPATTYDNYNNWKFATNGTTQDSITTGGVLNFKNGSNVTITRSALNEITFASSYTDTNTTYSHSAVSTTGGAFIRLTGSSGSTSDVKIASGSNITVSYTDASTISIANTYAYTHPAYTPIPAQNLTTNTIFSSIVVDALGSVTSIATRNLTLGDLGYVAPVDTNYYPTGMSFATGTGILTMSGVGMSNVTVNLDGRYLTSYTDTNTTYDHLAVATTGGAFIRLHSSAGTTDDIKLTSSGATVVSYIDDNTITISSTDTNTWVKNTATVDGYVTAPGVGVSGYVWKTDVNGTPGWRTITEHSAITLGTANGLSLSTQQLSLGLASSVSTGALSSTDWNTFNNKQPSGSYEGSLGNPSVTGYVLASTTLGVRYWVAQSSGGGGGTVTSVSGASNITGLTLSGTVTTSGSLTLGINGNVSFGGYSFSASEVTATSDRRRKFDVHDIELKPISARYVSHRLIEHPDQLRYGVIAQELLEENPELVRGNYVDGYTVNYTDLLIKEVAYLKDEIRKLKELAYGS